MADTPNDEAQPSASDPNAAHEAATRPTVKKKATKKATAKKKTASKKVAAKAGAAKKKVTKKKVPMTENVTPPLVSDTSTPQWDDDQGGTGLIGALVQWGPILLLVALILVLDSKDADDSHANAQQSGTTQSVTTAALAGELSTGGAIKLPDNVDSWALGQSGDASVEIVLGMGDIETTPDINWLEDPAAFYWGPAIVDEFPPAPGSSDSE